MDCTINIAVKHQIFAQTLSFITDMLGVILIVLGGYFVITSGGKEGVWQLTLGELAAFSSMRNMLANPLKKPWNGHKRPSEVHGFSRQGDGDILQPPHNTRP